MATLEKRQSVSEKETPGQTKGQSSTILWIWAVVLVLAGLLMAWKFLWG